MKKQCIAGNCLRGAWTVCRFKGGGGLGKKEGVVFLRGGWYPNANYEHYLNQEDPTTVELKKNQICFLQSLFAANQSHKMLWSVEGDILLLLVIYLAKASLADS